jgi:hypothetical protein
VNGESGRCPPRIGRVTCFTGGRQIQRDVTRVDTLRIIIGMTACTGVRCIVVITLVTLIARYTHVRTCKWPVVMAEIRWRPRRLSMTIGTISRK